MRWRKEGRESLLVAAAPPAGAPGLCEGEGEVGGWVRVPLSLPQPQSPEVVRRTTKEANEQPLLFSSRSTALSPLPHTHVARGRHISCAAASWRCRGRGGVGGWVGGWTSLLPLNHLRRTSSFFLLCSLASSSYSTYRLGRGQSLAWLGSGRWWCGCCGGVGWGGWGE